MNRPALRPLDFGEILDRAFAMYRRDFTRYFTTSMVLYLPLGVLWIALAFLAPASEEGMAAIELVQVLATPYSIGASLLMWGALTYQADRAYGGEQPGSRESYGAAGRRFLTLLGASALVALGMMLGFLLLVVPGILFVIMCFAVFPAIMLEGRGPISAIKRSRALARGAWGRVFGILLVLMIITSLPTMVVSTVGAMGLAVEPSEITAVGLLAYLLSQAAATVISALTLPLMVIGVLVLYYDRRVRLEGLDLEMETGRLASLV